MNDVPMIYDDKRPIRVVVTGGEGGEYWRIGHRDVVYIKPYCENGQMAAVTWFAIYDKDEQIISRVNSAFVEYVEYD